MTLPLAVQGRTPLFNCTASGRGRRLLSAGSGHAPASADLGSDTSSAFGGKPRHSAFAGTAAAALQLQLPAGGRRLAAAAGSWFLSANKSCEGLGGRPRLIGYVATWKVGCAQGCEIDRLIDE